MQTDYFDRFKVLLISIKDEIRILDSDIYFKIFLKYIIKRNYLKPCNASKNKVLIFELNQNWKSVT